MQPYTNSQNTSLLILRIVTAAIFYVAAYYKFSFWSGAPAGCLILAAFGAGKWSIDYNRGRK